MPLYSVNKKNKWLNSYRILAIMGLIAIAFSLSIGNIVMALACVAIPLSIIILRLFFDYPCTLLYGVFSVNYFILGIVRYVEISGISVLIDILLIVEFGIIIIHSVFYKNIKWKHAVNTLSVATFLWFIYCLFEIFNPSGLIASWILSRNLIFNGFFISVVSALVIVRFNQVKVFVNLLSVFTLLAIIKSIMQRYVGFDIYEQIWLDGGGAKTHIISSGIRYFSFFSDAGNFGSNMGFAVIFFAILTLYVKSRSYKVYYFIISLLSLYAMFLSGTRGAIAVPFGGLVMAICVSKNFKIVIIGTFLLFAAYSFFAFTTIGQSNSFIRRMRTAFNPSEDNSFIVREENQKKLAIYLKDKPFGEGLGLSGVENNGTSDRFTTQIATDSWYVKIWVETGIVGLILYISGFLAVILRCAYIILFRIRSREVKGYYIAMLSGVFGFLLSAYGNPFFGQFPTLIISIVFLSIVINGKELEDNMDENKLEN